MCFSFFLFLSFLSLVSHATQVDGKMNVPRHEKLVICLTRSLYGVQGKFVVISERQLGQGQGLTMGSSSIRLV
jgi:hypothetical protein